MLQVIQKIIFNVTGKKDITYDTDFIKDLNLNSFDIMNIICAFEEYFDTTIDNRDVWKLKQVKDVLAYMEERGIDINKVKR